MSSELLTHVTGYLGDDPAPVKAIKGEPLGISVGTTVSFDPPETRWVDALIFDEDQQEEVGKLRKGDAVALVGRIEAKPGTDKTFYRMKPLYRVGKVKFFPKSEKRETPKERSEPMGW